MKDRIKFNYDGVDTGEEYSLRAKIIKNNYYRDGKIVFSLLPNKTVKKLAKLVSIKHKDKVEEMMLDDEYVIENEIEHYYGFRESRHSTRGSLSYTDYDYVFVIKDGFFGGEIRRELTLSHVESFLESQTAVYQKELEGIRNKQEQIAKILKLNKMYDRFYNILSFIVKNKAVCENISDKCSVSANSNLYTESIDAYSDRVHKKHSIDIKTHNNNINLFDDSINNSFVITVCDCSEEMFSIVFTQPKYDLKTDSFADAVVDLRPVNNKYTATEIYNIINDCFSVVDAYIEDFDKNNKRVKEEHKCKVDDLVKMFEGG